MRGIDPDSEDAYPWGLVAVLVLALAGLAASLAAGRFGLARALAVGAIVAVVGYFLVDPGGRGRDG